MSDGAGKPIIGITVDAKPDPGDARTQGRLSLNWNYAQAIADAGGVPLLIPPQADPEAVAALIDGWLIPGGNDIDSRYWGEPLHEKAVLIDDARHDLERAIYERAPDTLPIFGICYGCQFLNVVEGGSLHQHLPDITGAADDQGGTLQEYAIDEDSKLAELVGAPYAAGESWHHQAVNRVAPTLRATARNGQGTVEALESPSRPWMVGVQWHPERTPDAEDTKRLFKAFIEAAAEFRRQRPNLRSIK